MTTELKASRLADQVVIKAHGTVVSKLSAEEAIKFAADLVKHADKILKATGGKERAEE
jgi:hypothetical protein